MNSDLRFIKTAILIIFAGFACVIFFGNGNPVRRAEAASSGPQAGKTGAPGEATCTDCHSQSPSFGQITINAPASYSAGQTYTIQVLQTSTDSARSIWGFELTSLTSSNAAAGTFVTLDAATRIRTANGRNYIEQSGSGNFDGTHSSVSWAFNWTAPASNVGAVTFYVAGLQGDNDGSDSGDVTVTSTKTVQFAAPVVLHHVFSDFDGDGKSDAAVFRPSEGTWYANRSTAGFIAQQWGLGTDKIAPADYDGDDKTDFAVWRSGQPSVAAFYILQSSNSTVRIEQFGQTGDEPTVGDWDGDGKADPAVYRDSASGSQSYFYYRGSLNNPSGAVTYKPWGTTGDLPMRGDFDGDGKVDAAVFRPSGNLWYISQSSNGQLRTDAWGLAGDKFVSGDFDGDAKSDLAVFRSGVWYIRQSSNGTAVYRQWGVATDLPVPADYDGDGKSDVAVYRSGVWYIAQSSNSALTVQSFGTATDVPAASVAVR